DAITGAGATPLLAHHFKKTVSKDDTDLDLDDFSFVGAAEFARQSLLIGRLGRYTGPRNNQLVLRTHGFGRGDGFRVHIDEGAEGQLWGVLIEREQTTTARERRTKAEQEVATLRTAVITATEDNGGEPVLKEQIKKQLSKWSGGKL